MAGPTKSAWRTFTFSSVALAVRSSCKTSPTSRSRALRHQLGLLQPEEIRKGRQQANDITQEQLAHAVDAAVATVSRWETGAVIQSRRADKALRRFFASHAERPLSSKVTQLVESLVSDLLNESRSEAEREALLEALSARKKKLGNLLATAVRE